MRKNGRSFGEGLSYARSFGSAFPSPCFSSNACAAKSEIEYATGIVRDGARAADVYLQHRLEEADANAAPLAALLYVEIQDAQRVHFVIDALV